MSSNAGAPAPKPSAAPTEGVDWTQDAELSSLLDESRRRAHGFMIKLAVIMLAYTFGLVALMPALIAAPASAWWTQAVEWLTQAGIPAKYFHWAVLFAVFTVAGVAVFILNWKLVRPMLRLSHLTPHGSWEEAFAEVSDRFDVLLQRNLKTLGVMKTLSAEKQALATEKQVLVSEVSRVKTSQESSLATLGAALALTNDLLILTDADGKIRDLSPTAVEMLGLRRANALGKGFHEAVKLYELKHEHPLDWPMQDLVKKVVELRAAAPRLEQALLVNADDQQMPVLVSGTAILDRKGAVVAALLRLDPFDAMPEQATPSAEPAAATGGQDPLTGLLSREAFEKRLAAVIDLARTHKVQHALLFLSIDGFERVNDVYGDQAGEQMLWQLGQIIREQAPASGECYRAASTHFALLLPQTRIQDAIRIAEKIRTSMHGREFKQQQTKYGVTVSIGAVPIGPDSEGHKVLLQHANQALGVAKSKGGNTVYEFAPDAPLLKQRKDDSEWAAWLTRSMKQGRAHFISQTIEPTQITDAGGMIEVLLRIEDDDGTWVSPGAFLPSIIRQNLTASLDLWLIKRVATLMAQNPEVLSRYPVVSVNLAQSSITEPDFAQRVVEVLVEVPEQARQICFEIDAGVSVDQPADFSRFVKWVHPTGARFALDRCKATLDIGVLTALPVDFVKIHESLVQNAQVNPLDQAYVEWINQAVHKLGRKTIATGVENDRALEQMRRIGVDFVQGTQVNKLGPLMA